MHGSTGPTRSATCKSAAMRESGGALGAAASRFWPLVEKLDAALFLDGAAVRAPLTGPIREPSCLGCYAADPDELRGQLDGYFTAERAARACRLSDQRGTNGHSLAGLTKIASRALLAPHIDYARGGVSTPGAYKELAERTRRRPVRHRRHVALLAARFTLTPAALQDTAGRRSNRPKLRRPHRRALRRRPLRRPARPRAGALDRAGGRVPAYLFERERPIRIVPLSGRVVRTTASRRDGEPAAAATLPG